MAEYQTIRSVGAGAQAAQIDAGLRAHMNKVYGLMSVGMLLTGGVAWAVGTSDALLSIFRDPVTLSPNILGWIVMFAPLGMVFMFGAAINRLSQAAAQLFFYAFAAVMGLSIAWIFKAFTGVSIAQTFLVTAIAFAGLSLWGYTTKRDLSGMGTFLMMGLIGILIAGLVNMFIGSSALQFAISVIGVVVFVGLTAFDTQRIKNDYLEYSYAEGQEMAAKRSVFDALGLYLNFINLFQLLLSLLGNRQSE